MSNQWLQIGSVRKGKTGSNYIKIDKEITLKAGTILQIQDPRKKIQEWIESGKLDEDKGMERLEKIPEYILKEIILPPEK